MGTARAARPTRPRLRCWQLAGAVLLLALVLDVVWLVRFGVASPARSILYVVLAICIGNPVRQLALGPARSRGLTECFMAGHIALAFLAFGVRGVQLPNAILLASMLVLGAAGVRYGEWRLLLNRRVSPWTVLSWALTLALVVRAEWAMDLPQITEPQATVFAWIDTPLWLNLAYGLERGFPAHELLFQGGLMNYHYGSGVVPLLIRHSTGTPMHIALAAGVVIFGFAGTTLLTTLVQRYCKVRSAAARLLSWVMPIAGALWFQRYVGNYPNVIGTALLLYVLIELQRARSWRSLALTFPTLLLLMLSKEVSYVAGLVFAGCLGLWALYRQRDWRVLARVAMLFVGTRLLYNPLVHMNQKVSVGPFHEHINPEWVVGILGWRAGVPLAVAVSIIGLLLWRRRLHSAAVLLASVATYVTLAALSIGVRPSLKPPSDPITEEWILIDMGQFETLGWQLLVLALLGVLLSEWARTRWGSRFPLLTALACVAALLAYSEDKYTRTAPPGPQHWAEEYRGPNAIVPVLAQIDPQTSLVASNHFNWNHENPHWAAFFGHQFFALRRGRWVTAYPHYRSHLQTQHAIYTAPRAEDAAALVRAEGITHVIVDKRAPTPWSGSTKPSIETDRYAVYQF